MSSGHVRMMPDSDLDVEKPPSKKDADKLNLLKKGDKKSGQMAAMKRRMMSTYKEEKGE